MKNRQETTRPPGYWDTLLARYYEGETTAEEETLLQAYLSTSRSGQKYDADRAVQAYTAMARLEAHRTVRPFRWLRRAQAISVAAALTALVWWAVPPAGLCEAYVNGKRYTRSEIVLQQMQNSLNTMQMPEVSVETELSGMFQELNTNR